MLLQETWLLPFEVRLQDSVYQDFVALSESSIDAGKLLVGRPCGGLSILWRKNLGSYIKYLIVNDNGLMACSLDKGY